MYERNAIVLERYFYGIFDFKNDCNLRNNYNNYRKLFDCYGALCSAKEKEETCKSEFLDASNKITELQKTHEKLYNRSAKYEYSRYIIFCNTEEGSETIEKHLNKVEEDVQRNNEELKELGENFVKAISDYNEKDTNLKNATSEREKAEQEYNEIYEKAKACYSEMPEELLEKVRQFIDSENKENKKELQEIFEDNGKNEKNQFDPDVISNAINKSIEIYKVEMEIYLAGYDRIEKLFEEIESDSLKNDKHTKYCRDSKAKLEFLNSEKDYVVQFLDNERIGAIYDKKTHRKLMLEACKKFALDFAQIDKLYDIIIKEAAGRWTKKIYKENYNKEYLIDLETVGEEPSLDTGRMRQEAIAFVNLNYWRVAGMREVYDAFEEVVTTIYERDLTEFLPEEPKPEEVIEELIPQEEAVSETVEEAVVEEAVPEIIEEATVEENVPESVEEVAVEEIVPESVEEVVEEQKTEEIIEEVHEEQEPVAEEVIEEVAIEEEPSLLEEFVNEQVAENNELEEVSENSEEEYFESEDEAIEAEQETEEEIVEEIEENEDVEEEPVSNVVYRSSKIALANAIYFSLQKREFATVHEEAIEDEPEIEDERDYSIPEKAQEILESIEEDNEKYSIPEKAQEILESLAEAEEFEVSKEPEVIEESSKEIEESVVEAITEEIEEPEAVENFEEADAVTEEVSEEPEIIEEQEPENNLIAEIEMLDDDDESKENTFDLSKLDDIEAEDGINEENIDLNIEDDIEYEEDSDEDAEDDSILEIYFSDSDDDEKEKQENGLNKKVGLFQKLVGFNSKKKKEA